MTRPTAPPLTATVTLTVAQLDVLVDAAIRHEIEHEDSDSADERAQAATARDVQDILAAARRNLARRRGTPDGRLTVVPNGAPT